MVGIAPKVSGHHYFGKGFPQGYLIDGQVKEGLQLVVGKTYVFQSNVSCFHPVRSCAGVHGPLALIDSFRARAVLYHQRRWRRHRRDHRRRRSSASHKRHCARAIRRPLTTIFQGAGDSICVGKGSLVFTPTAAQVRGRREAVVLRGCRSVVDRRLAPGRQAALLWLPQSRVHGRPHLRRERCFVRRLQMLCRASLSVCRLIVDCWRSGAPCTIAGAAAIPPALVCCIYTQTH